MQQRGKLLRVLGLGFGLAAVVGGVIGGGILRTPGAVAGQLGAAWLILLVWLIGGLYILLDANFGAELATMLPKDGGPYVYAHRAYGDYGGFVVGWSDWLLNVCGLAYLAVLAGEYWTSLFGSGFNEKAVAITLLIVMAAWNAIGVRSGSELQKIVSVAKGVGILIFVVLCFALASKGDVPLPPSSHAVEPLRFAGVILAVQLVLETYAGWNTVVYFAEENTNPGRNIPLAAFIGIFVVIGIYLLVNVALLYALPIPALAASNMPAAAVMTASFGARGGQITYALALLSLLGVLNVNVMYVPRTMFALARDGLFFAPAAIVNRGGTPIVALAMTILPALFLITVGSFEQLVATTQFFTIFGSVLIVIAFFLLRRREPDLPRPWRAKGYPYLPFINLLVVIALFLGYLAAAPQNSLYALAVLALSYPIFWVTKKLSRGRVQ